MSMRLQAVVLGVATVLAAAACGGPSSGSGSAGPSGGTLDVFAAASLTNAFGDLERTYEQRHPGWKVRLNLAGSDQLAAQIEQRAPADVFAAASPRYPEQLQGEKLLGRTTDFATNSLLLVTPRSNPAGIRTAADLEQGDAKVVVADPAVPLGAYTEDVLRNLGIDETRLNIVSKEQDAEAVLAKVTAGEADAGFVYVTDALSRKAKLQEIGFPAPADATATYPIGIVSDSKHTKAAQQWIDLVKGPRGQAVLERLGFGAAPTG
jgi:molybdate transport system substrate-binding protein